VNCPQLTVSRFSMAVSFWVSAHLLVLSVLDDAECQHQVGVWL
jgi:hypothetical protein